MTNLVTIEFASVSSSNWRRCQHCGMLYFAMCVMPGHRDTRPENLNHTHALRKFVFFICCLRFDQVLKNLLAVPWHGSLEQCISLFVKHCFHCCQNLEQKLNFFAIEFCIQVFADNYASQDFAVRSSTYPAGRV